jgi:hypothetical protein
VLFENSRVMFFEIRTYELCCLELKESPLIFIQEYLHKVFDFPNGLENVEDVKLAINTILALLIEENLTLARGLSKRRPLTEDQAANHALQDAESLKFEVGNIRSACNLIYFIFDFLNTELFISLNGFRYLIRRKHVVLGL